MSIDAAGWGDLLLGVVIGAHKLPEHKFMDRRIPVSSFQDFNFKNKKYLDDAVKIVEEIVEVMRPDNETRIKVCPLYVLSSIYIYLEKRGFHVERVETSGELRELVDRSYIRWCKEVGAPTLNLNQKNRFSLFLKWIAENPSERRKLVKTGWRSWNQKWLREVYKKPDQANLSNLNETLGRQN
jgi:hypothetical protein